MTLISTYTDVLQLASMACILRDIAKYQDSGYGMSSWRYVEDLISEIMLFEFWTRDIVNGGPKSSNGIALSWIAFG